MNDKKVLVVGAGAQGGACASILARDKDIPEIVLADIDIDLANRVKTRIKSSKLNTMKVDAGKIEEIEKAAKGADSIINMTLFEDGEYRKYPVFSKCENYDFPDPVGTIPLVYHQHQEPISLPYFIGKGIKNCDFKYTVDREVGTFIRAGFAGSEPVEVKGAKILPQDVLLKLVPRPVDTFFTEGDG